jgi:DHA2 family multidrug resistance protein
MANPNVIAGSQKKIVTFAIMLATIIQVLDTTIANVALPHMQGSLLATQDQISWVLTSYIVASAIMTLPTGWLAGRYGRKRILLLSVAGFTLSSMLCGLATSLGQMVLFRLLQGCSARRWSRCPNQRCSISMNARITARPWRCGAWV